MKAGETRMADTEPIGPHEREVLRVFACIIDRVAARTILDGTRYLVDGRNAQECHVVRATT